MQFKGHVVGCSPWVGGQVGSAFGYILAVLGPSCVVPGYPAQPAPFCRAHHGPISSSMAMISSRAARTSSGQAILLISWQNWRRRVMSRSFLLWECNFYHLLYNRSYVVRRFNSQERRGRNGKSPSFRAGMRVESSLLSAYQNL